MSDRKRVMFVCYGDAARSLMAENILREYAGNEFESFSGGVYPYRVPREVAEVMRDFDVTITDEQLKWAEQYSGEEFDYVIAIDRRAAANLPMFRGRAERVSWDLDDVPDVRGRSASERVNLYRWLQSEVASRVLKWLRELPR